jgi:hypothetical protein
MMNSEPKHKKPIFLLPLIALSLLIGIWTGWIRIGWNFPFTQNTGDHGALMVGGFIGTLICLERTSNFKDKIALLVPFVNALSIIFFLIKLPHIAFWFLLAGSIGLTLIYLKLYYEFSEIYILIMTAGAFCYLIGNIILIKTNFYPSAAMWWIAFLYFTILGERLELSRYLQIKAIHKITLIILLAVYIVGILIPFHSSGGYVTALSLIGSALWLYKYDMAKKSLQRGGQHFYSGVVLLTGYFWLIITGLFMAYGSYSGIVYDAVIHSFFLGFVFSMIFAHAPIILPGVLKLQINIFNRSLYFWFVLLQVSLIIRILGSVVTSTDFKMIGGITNGIAILGFILNIAILAIIRKKAIPLSS